MIRNKGLGCDLITEMIFGKQKLGRPKMRFVDNIKDIAESGFAMIIREAEGGENWRIFCRGAMADHLNNV